MGFKKLTKSSGTADTPDQLIQDLPRRKIVTLFDHQGQMLRNYHSEALHTADVAFQLPTGSGKTLVSLLLAEWRRRTFNERIVYLCPTNQLVKQVVHEANFKYGIAAEGFTTKVKDFTAASKFSYEQAKKVAVTTYSHLFNTNPYFSDPHVIILDDAHASENYIASHWSVRFDKHEECDRVVFDALAPILANAISHSSKLRLTKDINSSDLEPGWVDKVPYHNFLKISNELREKLDTILKDEEFSQRYPWSVIRDNLFACNLYFSESEILIRPFIPPTWTHTPFNQAKQRIYMSATLGEGGDLERLTGRPVIKRLQIPTGWDQRGIGRRYFIFPELSLPEDECLRLRHELISQTERSVIITPRTRDANLIKEQVKSSLPHTIYDAADLENDKNEFETANKAVAIIANRYDGIDFPDEQCRLLFINSLPKATNLQERFIMSRMGASLLFHERVQTRVIQAIGRCTRGLNDYSAVVVSGDELPSYLTDIDRRKYFNPELQAELQFGIDQSDGTTVDEIVENFVIFLEHGEEWEDADQGIVDERKSKQQLKPEGVADLQESVQKEIEWQRHLWKSNFKSAYDSARDVLGILSSRPLRGYRAWWHYLASAAAEASTEIKNDDMTDASREQYENATNNADNLSWLLNLSRSREENRSENLDNEIATTIQIENLEQYLSNVGNVRNAKFNDLETQISLHLSKGSTFERGQVLLGQHLGFKTGKVERSGSPDPWWIVHNLAIVFEDHVNADKLNSEVDVKKARQAASHPVWMLENVPDAKNCSIIPVLVTPAKYMEEGAVPHLKNVAYWKPEDFISWSNLALETVREIRKSYREPGDMLWRAQARKSLIKINATAPTLYKWLQSRPANTFLTKRR